MTISKKKEAFHYSEDYSGVISFATHSKSSEVPSFPHYVQKCELRLHQGAQLSKHTSKNYMMNKADCKANN